MTMLLSAALAASRPCQAEVLNDLSSIPPVSVTMQAVYFLAAVPPSLSLFGASPHAAALSASPPTANTETIRIPRRARKTVSFPLHTARGSRWQP